MLREFYNNNFIKSNISKTKNYRKTRRVDEILLQKIKLIKKTSRYTQSQVEKKL